ncbi:hypothetical protein [Streptomyces fulvorobeus]|uniref:Uncharacterized protein n=1 Tax=Streptomyces fulvorobeus TaxID=284028 RepID=A0A7J0CE54_9ACTN|nr:hypothetical protein [Streptomyces fulvorobeus]NYE44264.1 hypothetical protein [Streptomyces fulvorobeus]GFN00780.1 hypothetical protein Sfulv_55900 [Streptomyces fulvorobeus]
MTATPMHVRMARKYGQTAVLYAALALSAPGEYKLALMAGWDPSVAWLMPAVLSLYAAISASIAKAYKTTAREAAGTPHEAEAKRRSKNATVGALLALLMATAAQITEHVITATAFGATLWVIVVVSAVPPLVAAHVLHIDPPMELKEPEQPLAPEWVREELARREEAAREPDVILEEKLPDPPTEATYEPVLVTYGQAADALGLSEITIRGAANGDRLRKYEGAEPRRVYVDMRECHTVFAKSRQRAGV